MASTALGCISPRPDNDVIDPMAEPVVSTVRDGLLHVDGARGIGIVAMSPGDRCADRGGGQERGLAAGGIVNCGHSGRMGAYAEQAAAAGCLAISFGGGGRRLWGNVVPFGGIEPVMSTNPYTLGLPGLPDDPVVCDFAISTVATGKVAVARANGETLPPDAAIDRHGNPTRGPGGLLRRRGVAAGGGPQRAAGLGSLPNWPATPCWGTAWNTIG